MKTSFVIKLFFFPFLLMSCNNIRSLNNSSSESTNIIETELPTYEVFYHPSYVFQSLIGFEVPKDVLKNQYPCFLFRNGEGQLFEKELSINNNINGKIKVLFHIDDKLFLNNCGFLSPIIHIEYKGKELKYFAKFNLNAEPSYDMRDYLSIIHDKDKYTINDFSFNPDQNNEIKIYDEEIKKEIINIIQNDCLYIGYELAVQYIQ